MLCNNENHLSCYICYRYLMYVLEKPETRHVQQHNNNNFEDAILNNIRDSELQFFFPESHSDQQEDKAISHAESIRMTRSALPQIHRQDISGFYSSLQSKNYLW